MNFLSLAGALITTLACSVSSIENNLVKHNVANYGVATDGNQVRIDISDTNTNAPLSKFYELCDNLSASSYSYEYKAVIHHICWNDDNYSTETYNDNALNNDFFNEIFRDMFIGVVYDDDDYTLLSFKWVYSSFYVFHTYKLAVTPSIPTYSLTRYDFLTLGDKLLGGNNTGSYSFYINKQSSLSNGFYNSRVGISQIYYDDIDEGLIFNGSDLLSYDNFNGEFYELTNNFNAFWLQVGEFSTVNMSISSYAHANSLVRTNRNYLTDFYNKVYANYQGSFVYTPFNVNDNSYNSGYNHGFADGYQAGEDGGYVDGYQAGDTDGYNRGYNTGYSAGVSNTNFQFTNLFGAIADVPVLIVRNLFNFDFFGVNLLSVILSLFTALLVLWIARKLL